MERPQLTKEQVALAERREGVSHPVLNLLEKLKTEIAEGTLGSLADELEELDSFSLEPLELVAIWSKVGEVGISQRYAFAGMLTLAYALSKEIKTDWKGATRFYLENGKLPQTIAKDVDALKAIESGLGDIDENLGVLEFYRSGTSDAVSLASELARRVISGDREAFLRLQELRDRQKEYQTPVVSQLRENFGNGMLGLRLALSAASS